MGLMTIRRSLSLVLAKCESLIWEMEWCSCSQGRFCNILFSFIEDSVCTNIMTNSCVFFGEKFNVVRRFFFYIPKTENIMVEKLTWGTRKSLSVMQYAGSSSDWVSWIGVFYRLLLISCLLLSKIIRKKNPNCLHSL